LLQYELNAPRVRGTRTIVEVDHELPVVARVSPVNARGSRSLPWASEFPWASELSCRELAASGRCLARPRCPLGMGKGGPCDMPAEVDAHRRHDAAEASGVP